MNIKDKLVFLTDGTRMGSSKCRGYDIAEKLNCRIDIPVNKIKENDIVIMVKKLDKKVFDYTDNIYCDIVDGARGIYDELKKFESVKIMTLSPYGAEFIQNTFPNHEIVWIPHSHCNDENYIRPEREVKQIIYNGVNQGFPVGLWKKFSSKIEKYGLNAVRLHTIADKNNADQLRMRCCMAYYFSDIQVAFRKQEFTDMPLLMKCATKLNNAGSFAIPSVAYPEPAFEYNYNKAGAYIPVLSIDDMVEACVRLKENKQLYREIAFQSWLDAQKYHINKMIHWYEQLELNK